MHGRDLLVSRLNNSRLCLVEFSTIVLPRYSVLPLDTTYTEATIIILIPQQNHHLQQQSRHYDTQAYSSSSTTASLQQQPPL